MKKSDVIVRGDYGRYPAVNVKVYDDPRQAALPDELEPEERDAFYLFVLTMSDEDMQVWWDFACESGFEDLQSDAEQLFGSHVKVHTDGRSGGWAVVHGLGDVESWDAIALSKWARFAKWARGTADCVPESTLSLIQINLWEPMQEQRARDLAEQDVPDVFRALNATRRLQEA